MEQPSSSSLTMVPAKGHSRVDSDVTKFQVPGTSSSHVTKFLVSEVSRSEVPQNAIVPVGRPRPYSIIILNMRFIPKTSLTASSQITAS